MKLEKYKAIFNKGGLSVEVTALCFENRPNNEWYEVRLQNSGAHVSIIGVTMLLAGISFETAVERAKDHLDKAFAELKAIVEAT